MIALSAVDGLAAVSLPKGGLIILIANAQHHISLSRARALSLSPSLIAFEM